MSLLDLIQNAYPSPRTLGTSTFGDDGGLDTPANRAAITASARAGAAAMAAGKSPTVQNLSAVAIQGLMAASAFAPEIAPFVGAGIALFYGLQATLAMLPQAHGAGGRRCPLNDCEWRGLFDLKHEWPPKDPDDPRWVRYGETRAGRGGLLEDLCRLTPDPAPLPTENAFESYYRDALTHAYELWANVKLPIFSARAVLVGCIDAWNPEHTLPEVVYGATSPLQSWGDTPKNMAEYIRLVLSPDWNGSDVAPSPGLQTVNIGTPARQIPKLSAVRGILAPPSTVQSGVKRQVMLLTPAVLSAMLAPAPPRPPFFIRLMQVFGLHPKGY